MAMQPVAAKEQCVLCGKEEARLVTPAELSDREAEAWECTVCGAFGATVEVIEDELIRMSAKDKAKISAFTRSALMAQRPVPVFSNRVLIIPRLKCVSLALKDALAAFPHDVGERLDRGLLNLSRMSDKPGAFVRLTGWDFPVLYAEDEETKNFFIKQLVNKGWLELEGETHLNSIRLTVAGWNRVAELERAGLGFESSQGFVAMWFEEAMDRAYYDGIKPAIEEAGFYPRRIDLVQHNNKVCDEIIAEIRKSRFLVAEFTGHRGGVYFEAGFAMGLGIPVIFVCRHDAIGGAHFDTRQYNHIVWTDDADLRAKLKARIEATVPRPSTRSQR
jgi:nucleoside 2-deoxyribosyltransferase